MAAFVKEAAKRGATGFGQGSEYMGSTSIHIGGGNTPGAPSAAWGSGKPWLLKAMNEGYQDRVMANAGRLGAEGAHAGPPLSSGPRVQRQLQERQSEHQLQHQHLHQRRGHGQLHVS
jgi:hypothetical protein